MRTLLSRLILQPAARHPTAPRTLYSRHPACSRVDLRPRRRATRQVLSDLAIADGDASGLDEPLHSIRATLALVDFVLQTPLHPCEGKQGRRSMRSP